MSLQEQWSSFSNAIRELAPRTADSIRPPAISADVAAAESATSPWTDELREFFRLHDGQDDIPGMGNVLPTGGLLAVNQIAFHHGQMIEVMGELVADDPEYYDGSYSDLVVAFSGAGRDTEDRLFLPGYIPITKWDSNYTYCDVRAGRHRGCVSHRDKEGGSMGQPQWESLSHMIDDLHESLVTGGTLGWYRPRSVEGSLQWLMAS